jgi:hypothetical protein
MQARLDQLLMCEPVVAGMNVLVLFSLAHYYRSTNEHTTPIVIAPVTAGIYRIVDGRHRALASLIAGRKTVEARIENA